MPLPRASRLLVVIPAWNEQASVGHVVEEVRQVRPDAHVLVVNDGSTDDTAGVARRAGAEVLTLPYNLGVGGAMRAGFRFAQWRDHDVVVQIDADGQHDPRDLDALLGRLDEANVVIGARFDGDSHYRVGRSRRLAISILSRRLSGMTRTRLTDVTSGFRAADRAAIALFARTYPVEYLGDTIESLVIGARAGLRIEQMSVQMRPRRAGAPTQGPWKSFTYLVRALVVLALSTVRERPRRRVPPERQRRARAGLPYPEPSPAPPVVAYSGDHPGGGSG